MFGNNQYLRQTPVLSPNLVTIQYEACRRLFLLYLQPGRRDHTQGEYFCQFHKNRQVQHASVHLC